MTSKSINQDSVLSFFIFFLHFLKCCHKITIALICVVFLCFSCNCLILIENYNYQCTVIQKIKKYWIKKLVLFTETPIAPTNFAYLGSTVEMMTVS